MLLDRATLDSIVAGRISLVFRRWKRPTVKAGGTLKTAVGVLRIDAVDDVAMSRITAADARRAGYDSLAALRRDLQSRDGTTYRIRVGYAGADPRIALREAPIADDHEMDELHRALARSGTWPRQYLELIEARPAERAPDLAASIGADTKPFKQRVRRLKALGLTESLKVGYRLSPRGASYLVRLRGQD